MKFIQWIWALIVVLTGACVGQVIVSGLGHEASLQAPDGWDRLEEQVPFRRSDLMGDLPASPSSHSLDHFMAMSAKAPSQTWDLTVQLGEGSEVRVLPSGQVKAPRHGGGHSTAGNRVVGDGLLIWRAKGGGVTGTHFDDKQSRGLSCQGSLPAPTDAPYSLQFEQTAKGFIATSGQGQMQCDAQFKSGTPTLMTGLHRVQVLRSQTDHSSFSGTGTMPAPLAAFFGGLGGIFFWWLERRRGADHRVSALTSLPLLLAWPLQGADGLAVVEQLRMPGLSPAFVALWIPLALTLPLKAAHHLARSARRHERWQKGLFISSAAGGLLLLAISVIAQPRWPLAGVYFTLAGILFGALIAVNALAKRLQFVNIVSLVLLCAGLCATEWGLRFTATGVTWSPSGRMQFDEQLGWTKSTFSDFEALEKGQHTDYPSEGYPVAIPSTKKAKRVVCLGSSATGGAFQNDDLAEFYPARLQELLGGEAQVLNQGVGGWTSFHIARYAEKKAEELQPDILTVYIGHNDVLTKTSAPYKTLFGHWKEGKGLQTPLPNVRLFQGLRFALTAIAKPSGSIAVPVDHARENLEGLHDIAQKMGAKLLLMPEAITPDSAALTEYDTMLRKLAESSEDIDYLDVPSLLLDATKDYFLDDVHLSEQGHRRLANAMAERLAENKWLLPSEGEQVLHE